MTEQQYTIRPFDSHDEVDDLERDGYTYDEKEVSETDREGTSDD